LPKGGRTIGTSQWGVNTKNWKLVCDSYDVQKPIETSKLQPIDPTPTQGTAFSQTLQFATASPAKSLIERAASGSIAGQERIALDPQPQASAQRALHKQ
jgi:hypothetical protein